MAHYLVRAVPIPDHLEALRERIEAGEIEELRPFGRALTHSLREARQEPDGTAVWEEEDYCRPPLAQERAAVLDHHFSNLRVEAVRAGEGWGAIEGLPSLWGPAA